MDGCSPSDSEPGGYNPSSGEVSRALRGLDDRDPVAVVLADLAGRASEIATALAGEALHCEVMLAGAAGEFNACLISFLPGGQVVRPRDEGPVATGVRPHLTLHGKCSDVIAVVQNRLDTSEAVRLGVLVFHVRPTQLLPRYARVMRVVASVLARRVESP